MFVVDDRYMRDGGITYEDQRSHLRGGVVTKVNPGRRKAWQNDFKALTSSKCGSLEGYSGH